jgi:hypothetical protein
LRTRLRGGSWLGRALLAAPAGTGIWEIPEDASVVRHREGV